MPRLNLKPTHKCIKDYYVTLQELTEQSITHEGAVSAPFGTLLNICAKQIDATFSQQYQMQTTSGDRIIIDGAVTKLGIPLGYWEAKDIHDYLPQAVQQKRQAGYPLDNILFQTPERGILIQNGQTVLDIDLTDSKNLITTLQHLFGYKANVHEDWEKAVADFKTQVPDLATEMLNMIERQHNDDPEFRTAFNGFYETCKSAINPNLSRTAVEEMLIQHILTERIFREVFDRSDFTRRNIIAREIEKVTDALMRHSVSRDEFLQPLDRFYIAIEDAAKGCRDFSQKQHLLNTFYEQFFQGFSADVADTHGIVYTPQPIVDFMVNSTAHILETEFGRSLSDSGVHIIDPFVGTGNFIVRLMRDIDGMALKHKYQHELHCNEVMLLPYYIASLNIEQEYYQRTGQYLPFEGIALADTFELMENNQMTLFSEENTERVAKQKNTDMFVVIGNPPYNTQQVNDMDNNRNRPYDTIDGKIKETYVADSQATLRNKLYDPYVRAIRWATDRIGEKGLITFVTNNSFLDGIAFDGMRKHLELDFSKIYHINLKGNARTSGEQRRKEGGNVFDDQIRVGVGITFLIKKPEKTSDQADVWVYSVDDYQKAHIKQDLLVGFKDYTNVPMKQAEIDVKHTWLTEGLQAEFDGFIPMGTKDAKSVEETTVDVIFKTYSNGIVSSRDAWVYNFNRTALADNIQTMINTYNTEMDRWRRREDQQVDIRDFVNYDDKNIKWDRELRLQLQRGRCTEYNKDKVRLSLYRPFTKSNLYFERNLINCVYIIPTFFPTPETEKENLAIGLRTIGSNRAFHCLMVNVIPDFHLTGDSQCFPFYIYDEDGTNRKENITDWALDAFRKHYKDDTITKWDIFHYTYAVLHHPEYREKYQANLKRDLPHIPYIPEPNFRSFVDAGAELADIHVNYEEYPVYSDLTFIENQDIPINLRVEKMKLSKDKTELIYNDYLTISGIPPEVFEYRLGTRSALEWIIDQYRVKTDKRSGIINDPNRPDDENYIVNLIGRIISVSLRTVAIVKSLPTPLSIDFV